jgi:hypothetical protein
VLFYRDASCNIAKTFTCFAFRCSNEDHIHTILQSIGKQEIMFVRFELSEALGFRDCVIFSELFHLGVLTG